jgi:4-hydroxy-2-oxoheptanedioate aldolase
MAKLLGVHHVRERQGVANLDDILTRVPGIGCVLIGEVISARELGFPGEYEHPRVHEASGARGGHLQKHQVASGAPACDIEQCGSGCWPGFTFIMSAPVRSYTGRSRRRRRPCPGLPQVPLKCRTCL